MTDKQNYFTYIDNTSDDNDKTMESLHKQIIIDGVDVADCEHINACDKKMKCVILQDDVCETNPYCEGFNCYYKQFKRKEQEVEQYKRSKQASYEAIQTKCNELELENRELRAVHSTNVALSDELFKYKAENEELKNKLTKSIFEDGKKQIALDIAIYERDKLKQTLDEIKEIAESCGWNFGSEILYKRIEQILQKINECEVNNG